MRWISKAAFFCMCCFSCWPLACYGQGRPVPPGVREADKQSNVSVEPPAATNRKTADPAAIKREADELQQLTSDVDKEVGSLTEGRLPQDLIKKLKRIEKLAKEMRGQVSP